MTHLFTCVHLCLRVCAHVRACVRACVNHMAMGQGALELALQAN